MIAAALAPEALAMAPKAWPKHDARLARNRRLYTRVFEGARGPMHVMERWARYADWLTGTPAPAPVARLADDGLAAPVSFERPTVAIQPFSAVALKQPAPDLWRAVLAEVPPDHDVLLLGAPADLARSPAHADLLNRPQVRFEPAPFAQLVPILRGCRLVVSADTATAHLAIAVGAPTVVLASAAWTGELVPYPPALIPPGAEFIYVAMPCAGCFANCVLPAEDGMYPCVARLDPRRIAARVGERLTGGSSNEGAGR